MQESKTNILLESVRVNKWAQRLMYTIQTENVGKKSLWEESEYGKVLVELGDVCLVLERTVRIVDNMVRKSHPASDK